MKRFEKIRLGFGLPIKINKAIEEKRLLNCMCIYVDRIRKHRTSKSKFKYKKCTVAKGYVF